MCARFICPYSYRRLRAERKFDSVKCHAIYSLNLLVAQLHFMKSYDIYFPIQGTKTMGENVEDAPATGTEGREETNAH